ncbi:MAG TPA: iron-containing redox enzyme family protein [Candidatus Binatia bacterium]|nr:iron-containing redox enzyme family protein [Candidatus Binatia bacterium]
MGLVTERAVSAREFLSECQTFKRDHAPQGAFLRGLVMGKLSDAQIKLWAKDFYYYVEPAIPTIAGWLSNAPTLPDREIYRLIARNLAGEMGYIKEAEHHDLYLQFCAGLGITRAELLEHLPLGSTIGAASTMGYYCRNSFEEGLGAFGLAVEMEVPGRPNGAKVIYDGLRRHYGLDDTALEFWAIHIAAEEEHGDNAVKALEHCGQTREQQARIRRAFQFSVVSHAGMVNGYDRFLDRSQ